MDLETDERGLVTFLPMLEWGVSLVNGKTVGLSFDYYASAEDLAAGRKTRVQVHLEAENAKHLARVLDSRGDMILSGQTKSA